MAWPKLSWKDLIWFLLPILIWVGGIHALKTFPRLTCLPPQECLHNDLNPVDWPVVEMGSKHVNQQARFSDWTQFSQAGLAIATVGAVAAASPQARLATFFTDLVILFEVTFWNGAFNSIARFVVQRPRPYVYADPSRSAHIPGSYTSFYSGHTSFVFAALAFMFLMFKARRPARLKKWTQPILFVGTILASATGALRVAGAQHFTTDVFFSIFAGLFVAWFVVFLRRKTINKTA